MRCKTCEGTYEPVLPSGARYFHACPPEFDADNQRWIERKDKRDENVRVTGLDKNGNPQTTAKSEGKGSATVSA